MCIRDRYEYWRPKYCDYWECDERYRTPSTASSTCSINIRNGWSTLTIKSAEPLDISNACNICSRNTASTPSTRIPPPESNLLQLPFVGPSVNSECCLQKMRIKLSKRTDGRNILHTPRILRRVKVFWYYLYTECSQDQFTLYQPDEILPALGSTRTTDPSNTWKCSSIPQAEYSAEVVNAEILRVWHYLQYTISI